MIVANESSRTTSDYPITTLFMLMSVDGKISTGSSDDMDVDKDFPNLPGTKEGLYQYYDIEQTTDLWSLNTGRVQEKMGVNNKKIPNKHSVVSFVIIDNSHLTKHGVEYFCALSKKFVLVTNNKKHPGFLVSKDNMSIIYQDKLDLKDLLFRLKHEHGCDRITIQSGGTMNNFFLRQNLFDYIDIVVAPILIGGKDTSTLIDGESLITSKQLSSLTRSLELIECKKLKSSYLRLRYKVLK